MKEGLPKGLGENQIRHILNKQILTGRHDGKFYKEGKPRLAPELPELPKHGNIFKK